LPWGTVGGPPGPLPQGYEALNGLEDQTKKDFTKELGKAYGRMKDRNQGGFMIVRRGGHAKTVKWSVLEVSEVSEVSATPYMTRETRPSGAGTGTDTRVSKEKRAEAQPSDTSDTSTPAPPAPRAKPQLRGRGDLGNLR